MSDGRRRDAWLHTSAVLAMLANNHRNAKKRPRPFKPEEFDPFRQAKERTISTAEWKLMLVKAGWVKEEP